MTWRLGETRQDLGERCGNRRCHLAIQSNLGKRLLSPAPTRGLSQQSQLTRSNTCSPEPGETHQGWERSPHSAPLENSKRGSWVKMCSLHRGRRSLGINNKTSIKTRTEQESATHPLYTGDSLGASSQPSSIPRGCWDEARQLHLTLQFLFPEKATPPPASSWSCFSSF